jgi:hypothetical protein
VYPASATVVSRAVDVLRIVEEGDIGVGVLRVDEVTPYTPTIRRTLAWDYEPEVTLFQPRRMAFDAPHESVLSEDAVATVRSLLPRHFAGLQQQGFEIAIRRFRDSYERYHPEDPGKLLDIAIAFEALLLSDGDNKELNHRLALRGARWLESSLDAKRATFKTLKTLYEVRSKIAHGASASITRTKLDLVLQQSPALLRRALKRALEGAGPMGRLDDDLKQWWLDRELE